jgi:hypothetical protein
MIGGNPPLWIQPEGEREMLKKLTASAATGFLLLGAAGVAMAQEFPPLVVFSVEATSDVVVDPPIAAGDPCVDAVQALRAVPLPLREINVIQQRFLTFVFSSASSGAILICAAEGTEPPAPPPA